MSEQAMPSTGDYREWLDTSWQSSLIRPLLLATLATCLAAGPLAIILYLVPAARPERVLPLCFLTALLGVYSTRWLVQPAQRLLHRVGFRLAELVLLLTLLRLATWLVSDHLPTVADARRWLLEPLSFFDALYVVTALLGLLAWERASAAAAIFQQLALNPSELAWFAAQREGSWRRRVPIELVRTSRRVLLSSFTVQWLIGGGVLVLCAGLSRVRVTSELGLHLSKLGLPPLLVTAIVAYFLIGLVLVSQGRLAMLRAQWLYEGAESAAELPGRWQRISLLLILAIGLAASLLPLGSTWHAGEMLAILVTALVQLLYLLVFGVFALFMALLGFLGLGGRPEEQRLLVRPELLRLEEPTAQPTGRGLPPWLGGAGFWLVTLAIVVYALVYLLGKRGIALNWSTLRGLLARLWQRLRGWWLSARHLAATMQATRLSPHKDQAVKRATRRQPWRFLRLGGLPPRAKVRYFYLSTIRRAADRGVVRRPSQTPREFAQRLEDVWPEIELDVEALTEAFIAARYDAVEISEPQAKDVQTVWQRIKKTLRRGKAAPNQRPK